MLQVLTMSVTHRDPKGSSFVRKCEAVYNKAGLDEDRAQRLNEDPIFETELAALIERRSQPDDRFELITSFEVTVPADYVHDTCLTTFDKAHKNEFYYYNGALTDKNFAKTPALVSGKKFLVKIFQIRRWVTSDVCLAQLKRAGATLVGAQGASLVYEQCGSELPKNKLCISFAEKETLWQDEFGRSRLPGLYMDSHCGFKFMLNFLSDIWGSDVCLLAFCDVDAK